ncbi:MAG: Pantetheine-phosphate adenylyltransferase [Candidatus Uhrbacteria bacterium GW2011_GWF2_39_13]|uniref:Phosphopantetheine adenylyltransferase n=1 Tax=Candidatus Uhrbacteria bacterium GW2011_GWF2_39_13 TaxID=1618995 RepID=A0A0G0QRU1_9BACT|nr:MAG: Pantetheine-phosphate adenylyltransferase [Candidatus Uhrbacteria bacterium GW2011_GWF2_39_13]HAU66606.1 pantetheine-phosphate adenylyltransferase [Candidatus Uhrbacteria bacterium]
MFIKWILWLVSLLRKAKKPLFYRGLVPISGDPITNGHIDLIRRAAQNCLTLIVLIANNEEKVGKYTFLLEERLSMAKRALVSLKNVEVLSSDGLLVDVFMREGCDVVFRGIRNEQDREYELQQMRYNNLLFPGFSEHVNFLPARQELSEISSSLVKALVLQGVDVSAYVPLFIKAALEKRLREQIFVGITGEIASGKTWVATQLTQRLGGVYINFDEIIREFYDQQTPGAQLVRNELTRLFGPEVLVQEGTRVDRQILKTRIFSHPSSGEMIKMVESLTAPHVMRLYRQKLTRAKGLVIVEWAQMAKMGMSPLVNNNVIVVESADLEVFLEKREIDSGTFNRVLSHQWSAQHQRDLLKIVADRDEYGDIMLYQNYLDPERSNTSLTELEEFVRGLNS